MSVLHEVPFADFVAARSSRLLHLAYLLTRDRGQAEDLVQTALARAWPVWGRIADPEAYVRRIMVTTYSAWWRRPLPHHLPKLDVRRDRLFLRPRPGQPPDAGGERTQGGCGSDDHCRAAARHRSMGALPHRVGPPAPVGRHGAHILLKR
ncbi:sigma factor [Hamadaea flava]|uniref:Sigma factor n=1 Tax=Hamadaea flava TaxID=1742688 RepID=A0ABV8LMF1_9ACTN